MKWHLSVAMAAAAGASVACGRAEGRSKSPAAQVVDSIFTRDEAIRRFRHGLPPASALGGGRDSRDALLAGVVRAVGDRDTAALAAMAVSRSEFAYLYYPSAPLGLAPYNLDPELMWHMLVQRSERGLRRSLERFGGQRLHLVSYDCGREASREGANTVSGPCALRVGVENGPARSVSVGQIIERGGRYKILSYADNR